MNIEMLERFLATSFPVEGYDGGQTVMGIDPSPNNTGIAVLTNGRMKTFTIGWGAEVNAVSRLDKFDTEISDILVRYRPKAIAIEGYSFGSKFSQPHKLGEVGGVLKLAIMRYGLIRSAPLIVVPPTTLKQFVRGVGKGTKAEMLKDAKARWGFKTSQNDEIDAGALAFVAATVQYQIPEKFGHVLYKDEKGKGGVEFFRW